MLKKVLVYSLFTLCIFIVSCTSKVEKIKNDINNEEIELAYQSYKELSEDEKVQVDEIVKSQIDETYQLFIEDKLNGIDALDKVKELDDFNGISKYAQEVKDKMTTIMTSRKVFDLAQQQESTGKFVEAMSNYKDVKEIDTDNYKVAQQKIIELQETVDIELKKIEEANLKKEQERLAKEEAENNKYAITSVSIVPTSFNINDGIQVIIQNNTDVTAKEIVIGFFIYDNNGFPIKFGLLAGGDLYLSAGDTNANIAPGGTYGLDKVVNTYLDPGTIGYVKACVVRVVDYDGNEWFNNSYAKWYTDSYDKKYE